MKYAVALCLTFVFLANVASAAIVNESLSSTSTLHRERLPADRTETVIDPQIAVSSVSLPIGNFSTTTISFGGQEFVSTFTQHRPGSTGSNSTGVTVAQFTVTSNYSFTLDGSFASTRGSSYFSTELYDATANISLVDEFLLNSPTSPSVLSFNTFTGTLLAGHTYQWTVDAGLESLVNNLTGSTSIGIASLTLEELPAPTPEPATLAIWSGISLCGLIATYRRRKS